MGRGVCFQVLQITISCITYFRKIWIRQATQHKYLHACATIFYHSPWPLSRRCAEAFPSVLRPLQVPDSIMFSHVLLLLPASKGATKYYALLVILNFSFKLFNYLLLLILPITEVELSGLFQSTNFTIEEMFFICSII